MLQLQALVRQPRAFYRQGSSTFSIHGLAVAWIISRPLSSFSRNSICGSCAMRASAMPAFREAVPAPFVAATLSSAAIRSICAAPMDSTRRLAISSSTALSSVRFGLGLALCVVRQNHPTPPTEHLEKRQ